MNHTPCPQEADVRYWPCAHESGGYALFQADIPHTWPRQNVPALIMCYCIFTIFMIDGHFFTICRMPSNRSLYCSLILFQISLHNCPVASADTVTFQLFCQIPVSNIIFAYQQRSGGILINSVDNSGPHHSVNTGKAVTTMCHNCIDQCPLIMPGCWMYNHPLGLLTISTSSSS